MKLIDMDIGIKVYHNSKANGFCYQIKFSNMILFAVYDSANGEKLVGSKHGIERFKTKYEAIQAAQRCISYLVHEMNDKDEFAESQYLSVHLDNLIDVHKERARFRDAVKTGVECYLADNVI